MASSLSDFISLIKKNSIARINRFRVTFSLPDAIDTASIGSNVEKTLSLTCLMADLPGVQEQTSTISYGGYDRKVVYGRSVNDFSTTFLVTGKYLEKMVFDAWHKIINDEDNHAVEYYDDYISTITIECLNEADVVMYGFEITEAYPIAVSSVRLDRTAQNQQMVIDVNWAFYRIIPTTDDHTATNPIATINGLASTSVGAGTAVQRLAAVPGLDSFSAAVQATTSTVKEFRSQLQGVLDIASSVKDQVRDAKMSVLDGIKTLNGVVKDVKAIANIPTDVKNEVVSVVDGVKNGLGYLKDDVKSVSNYPKK